MQTTPWGELYVRTIQQVDSQKIREGITETRQAVTGRLQDLQHASDHHAERQQIENALRALSMLEGEVRDWK